MRSINISVDICNFNGEKFTSKKPKSILNKKELLDEIIICDDGSLDNNTEIIKSFIDLLKNYIFTNRNNKF